MPMNKKKVFKLAKGFYGRAKNCITIARPRVQKALQYQTRDRIVKKREHRESCIVAVNAAVRQYGIKYSAFVYGLQMSNIGLNRNMLTELAKNEPYSFRAVVDIVARRLMSETKEKPNLALQPFAAAFYSGTAAPASKMEALD
eukprot:TRINITY_DN20332_c0_g1_i1.p2 TRINITY_DN20332_c0_g1~~TRINITY_DN20332_c0_g1_i1.p2  ORF type:complete len:143 (-),score=26.10 TRINITY_DN20332_c0_g1_i1:291-719(-)